MPRGSYVTTTEAKRMAELRQSGLSARAVGKIVGRPHSSVLYIEKTRRQTVARGELHGRASDHV